MVIFIDESGIHKQSGHSSFAVAYVEVRNLETLNRKLVLINESLKITSFHWADHNWVIRKRYLKRILNLDFTFKIAIFDNPVDISRELGQIFKYLVTEKGIRSVCIDGKKPKWYENKLKKELRNHGVTVKKLRTVKNEISEPGIQLADALSGFSLYCFENLSDKSNKILFGKFKKADKLLVQMVF